MAQSLANLYVHLIFSTKERVPRLAASVRLDLHAYMATVLANLNSPAVLINSVADHMPLLFNMGRTVSLAQVVEDVRKSSSKWIKTQDAALTGFAWQAGYGACSFRNSARNCSRLASVKFQVLPSVRSQFRRVGPRKMLKPLFPMAFTAGAVKQLVSNQLLMVRLERLPLQVRFGWSG